MFLNTMTIALLAATTGIALITWPYWTFAIPRTQDIASNIWAGIFAAIIITYVQRITVSQPPPDSLLKKSREEVGPRLIELSKAQAYRNQTDPALLVSIMLAENLQRPKWTRILENLKGKIMPGGSYGVMQIGAEQPISDEESIRRAAKLLSGKRVSRDDGATDYDAIEECARRHNPNKDFIEMVTYFYTELHEEFG